MKPYLIESWRTPSKDGCVRRQITMPALSTMNPLMFCSWIIIRTEIFCILRGFYNPSQGWYNLRSDLRSYVSQRVRQLLPRNSGTGAKHQLWAWSMCQDFRLPPTACCHIQSHLELRVCPYAPQLLQSLTAAFRRDSSNTSVSWCQQEVTLKPLPLWDVH